MTSHHTHVHEGAGSKPAPVLERGCARGQLLFLDCFSGIAGDMTIAALLDLGVPPGVVRDAVASLPLPGTALRIEHDSRHGIGCTTFDVEVTTPQPSRPQREIDDLLASSRLDATVCETARRIFRRLAEAEAGVHQQPVEDVELHEVGSADAIIDIVGAAACLAYLNPASVVATPLPMSHGWVRAAHGTLPVPAPATVACLQGIPTYGVDIPAELVTPTGAAIVATVAQRFARWPAMAPWRVGYGGGHQNLPEQPNLLRVVLGEHTATDDGDGPTATHVLVEANVDDLTGELAGHTLAALLAAGALDAWATPLTMKKGRPGLTLAALAAAPLADAVAEVMLRESTTLGVRRTGLNRIARPRHQTIVETRFGKIAVKVGGGPYGPPQIKPEFDECAAAADAHGVPVRVVISEALTAAQRSLGNDE